MGRAQSRRNGASETTVCVARPPLAERDRTEYNVLRQSILSLAVILSTLVCVASYPVPPSGTVFCSKETGAVDIFTVGGNKAVFWENAGPPTVLFIGLNIDDS